MTEKVTYWVEIADYDFETAKAMLETKRYLYVGFMCHQVIEKMFKAYWSKVLEEPPLKIHTLSRLAENTGLLGLLSEEQLKFIDRMEPLNIESRYPDYKKRLLNSLNYEVCKDIIEQTDKLRSWIRQQL